MNEFDIYNKTLEETGSHTEAAAALEAFVYHRPLVRIRGKEYRIVGNDKIGGFYKGAHPKNGRYYSNYYPQVPIVIVEKAHD